MQEASRPYRLMAADAQLAFRTILRKFLIFKMAFRTDSPYKAQVAIDLPAQCPQCGNASIGVEQDNTVMCLD